MTTITTRRLGPFLKIGQQSRYPGAPFVDTGFPVRAYDESAYLNKPDPRKRPHPRSVRNGTSLIFNKFVTMDGGCFTLINTVGGTYSGPCETVGNNYSFPPVPPNLIDKAAQNLRTNIKNTDVNLLATLGEGKQAVNSLFAIARYMVDFKRNVPRSLKRWFFTQRTITTRDGLKTITRESRFGKDAANLLLQFDYGIRPILTDMVGTIDLLDQRLDDVPWNRALGFAKDQNRRSEKVPSRLYANDAPFIRMGLTSSSVRLISEYRVVNANQHSSTQAGFTNPLAAGYELLPFSFVVDAIIPIGNMLSNLDALKNIEGVFQTCSLVRSESVQSPTRGSGRLVHTKENKNRTFPDTLNNLPGGYFVGGYNPSSSLRSAMDLVAVLRQIH